MLRNEPARLQVGTERSAVEQNFVRRLLLIGMVALVLVCGIAPAPGAAPTSTAATAAGTACFERDFIVSYGETEDAAPRCDGYGPTRYFELPPVGPLDNARLMSCDDWARSVVAQARVYRNPATGKRTADVLVFVHGYAEGPRRLSARMRGLREDLQAFGYRGAVTAFHWPSPRRGVPFTYLRDVQVAKCTGERLINECLDPLRRAAPRGVDLRLHLMAHSLGATYVRSAFLDMPPCPAGPRLENLILVGGDVPACVFGRRPGWSYAGAAAQARLVTSYGCAQDTVLHVSNLVRLGTQPRLGLGGLEPSLAEGCAVAVDGTARFATLDTDALIHRFEAKTALNDIRLDGRPCCRKQPLLHRLVLRALGASTGAQPFFPSHEWYFEDPLALRDLRLLLQADGGDGAPPTRCLDRDGGIILRPDP